MDDADKRAIVMSILRQAQIAFGDHIPWVVRMSGQDVVMLPTDVDNPGRLQELFPDCRVLPLRIEPDERRDWFALQPEQNIPPGWDKQDD